MTKLSKNTSTSDIRWSVSSDPLTDKTSRPVETSGHAPWPAETKVPADRNILDIHDQETSSLLQESCTRQNVLQCSVADDAALESAHLIPATQMKKDKQSDELYK